MINFLVVFIMYTAIWLLGMYFILHRIFIIRRRTEHHILEFDGQSIPPSYRYAWVAAVLIGVLAYIISIGIILVFLRG